jgi:pimeloyl-ACP methyl ester carboxylesterase
VSVEHNEQEAYKSYRVMAGRVRMHIRDWPGEAPPIVFLHGISGNGLTALRLGKLLAHRRRLIAPDLRGRGQTDMPFGEYGIQVHMRDVITCMDELKIEQFVAAGHSMGAAISVFLAANYPARVTSLILFDGGALPGPMASQVLNAYYDTIQYQYTSIEDYVERFKGAPAFQPWTEELETLVRSNLYQQPDGTYIRRMARYVLDIERRIDAEALDRELTDLYPRIQCPVLILRAGTGLMGATDRALPDEVIAKMQSAMPTAEIVTIEEAGHTSLLTIPSDERDTALLQFLKLI